MTITSWFTRFIAHWGGPPIIAYVIPLRLFDWRNLFTSMVLRPFAPLGVRAAGGAYRDPH